MKKLITLSIAACLIVALAAPAMAAEFTYDGHLRSRGFLYDNHSMTNGGGTDAKYDSRFRLNFKIAPTEDVFVRGRIEQSYDWGNGDPKNGVDPVNNTTDSILKRAWITWRTAIGSLEVGRQTGKSWGLAWGDLEGATDRIKLTVPVSDQLVVLAIIEKDVEDDYYSPTESDLDTDKYYLAVNYAGETVTTGLLGAFAKSHGNNFFGFPTGDYSLEKYALVPYVNAGLMDGKLNILAELAYEFGSIDIADPAQTDPDIGALSYMLELNGAVSKFGWEAGYGYVQGQDDGDDFTVANAAYEGVGADWDKFVYFTDTMGRALLTGDGYTNAALGGVSIWWLGASFAATEQLNLSILGGMATAPNGSDNGWANDDYGTELDFKAKYAITDNLDYYFNFGYVMTGDGMADARGIALADLEDAYKMYHRFQVNF